MRPLWNRLTPSEQDLMGWIKTRADLTLQEVALAVGRTVQGLKNDLTRIYQKIGAESRPHAVVMLLEEKHAAEMEQVKTQLTETQACLIQFILRKAQLCKDRLGLTMEDAIDHECPEGAKNLMAMYQATSKLTPHP